MNLARERIFITMLFVLLGVGVFAIPSARADTTAELYAQIQSLTQQIKLLREVNDLKSGDATGVCAQTFSRALSLESTGSDVLALQRFLNRDLDTRVALYGAGAPGLETSYFGARTQSAVAKFQNKYRSTSTQTMQSGVVDNATRIQLRALCTNINGNSGADQPSTSASVSRASEHDSTIEEGSDGTLYAIDIQSGTTAVTLNTLTFNLSKDPTRYIDSFELYRENTRLQTIQADDANLVNGQHQLKITGIDSDISRNQTVTYSLHANVKSSISSNYRNDSIDITIPSRGVTVKTANNASMVLQNSTLASRTFDFKDSSNTSSVDNNITISEASNNPDDMDIEVSGNSSTKNITVLRTDLETSDSDIEITDIYVIIESDHDDASDVVRSLTLKDRNDTLETATIEKTGGADITVEDGNNKRHTVVEANTYYAHFENITDFTVDSNDTQELSVEAEFDEQTNNTYDDETEVTFILYALEGRDENNNRIVLSNLSIGDNTTFTLKTK